MECEKIAEKDVESKIWISAYIAKNNNNKFAITAVYRSPSSPETEY